MKTKLLTIGTLAILTTASAQPGAGTQPQTGRPATMNPNPGQNPTVMPSPTTNNAGTGIGTNMLGIGPEQMKRPGTNQLGIGTNAFGMGTNPFTLRTNPSATNLLTPTSRTNPRPRILHTPPPPPPSPPGTVPGTPPPR